MRKFYVGLLTVICVLLTTLVTNAQLTGTKTIPGDYATIAAAITDLNAQGVGASGVMFNVTAGHTENTSSQLTITATGVAGNPIVFQKSGAGANPKITRTDAGSNATTAIGALGDGIISLSGTDYITFDGIDLAATDQGIEYGYYTHKPSATDGCQFVTIKNAVITMNKGTSGMVVGINIGNGATSVSSATGVTVSASSGTNYTITLTGNTISNVHTGIYCRGSSAAGFPDSVLTIGQSGAGNTINNYGGGNTGTAYGVYMIYQKDVTVSYNTIDNAANGGSNFTGTAYGIFHSTAANGDGKYNSNTLTLASNTGQLRAIAFGTTGTADHIVMNNTISLSQAGTSEASCIYLSAAVGSVNIVNNTFSYGSFGSTTSSYLIYASSSTPDVTVTGNQISGAINKTGNGTFYCYYNLGSPTSGLETISDNTFSNITIAGGSSITGGIYSNTATGQNRVCFGNTISNWTVGSTGTTAPLYCLSANNNEVYNNTVFNITVSGAGTLYGLYFTGTNPTVSGNTIYNLSNGGTTTYGIWAAGTGTVNCYSNKVYNLDNTNSASTSANILTGIYTSAGATNNIYNNLVGNLSAPASVSPEAIRGIYVNQTAATTNANIYYNTVYLNASSTGANFGSTGIFHTTSATSTTGSLSLRNNIIINKSTAAGTGLTVAYRRSSNVTANYNSASNNNIFYAGAPSASNLIYADGTNAFSALGDYKLFILAAGADQNSETEDVPFQSTTGSSGDFLKFSTSVTTKAESGAENISGITLDFSGTIRQGNPGYVGTGLKPDVGAWELEGILPSCSGTPAASNTLASQNPGCAGQPVLLSLSQAYVGVTYQWQSSPDNVTYSNIAGETSSNYGLNAPASSTWYRAIISCGANNTISTPVQLIINPPLTGAYTINNLVPTGGTNYANFDDAFNDLNCRGISGPVVFNVSAGQVFSGTLPLNLTATGTSTNTISFVKSGAGANPKIQRTGTTATNEYVVRLTGSDYVTFDGIDFEQTGSSATDWVEYGIHITNASTTDGAWNNTFKNGAITLTNSYASSRGVYLQSPITPTASSGTNSNNRFLNMTISNSYEGYRFNGATSSFTDDGNEINTEAGGTSLVQNLGDSTVTGTMYGVYATYQSNLKVSNTQITFLRPGGTSTVYGITLQTSASNSAVISNNEIHNVIGGGAVTGISATSLDTASIYNNYIHGLYTTTATSSAIRGIDISGTGANVDIFNNRIQTIISHGATTTTAAGIDVATGLTYNIYNNMISGIRAPRSTTTSGGTRGITVSGGSTGGVVRIYYNTVYLNDIGGIGTYTSAGLHNSSTTPELDIRNNVVVNVSDISTLGTRVAAFWKTSATDNVAPTSNNNIYYAGTPDATHLIYYDGTTGAQTITAYNILPAITPGESASLTENVVFVDTANGILRVSTVSPTFIEGNAQPIAGIGSDFEGQARNATTPDIGADEDNFTVATQPVPGCAGIVSPANGVTNICSYQDLSLQWSAPVSGGTVTGGYDVYFGTSPAPPFVANTASFSYTPTGLLPNTTYYWQVIPKNGTGPATGCSVWSFTTVNAEVLTTTAGSTCGTGTVTLNATGGSTLKWYDVPTGGTPLGTGTTFITPAISTTTTYYVESATGLGTGFVGRNESTAGTSGTTASTYGLCFNALTDITIDSVTIILNSTGGGTLQLQLRDSLNGSSGAGTFIRASANIPVPAGTVGQRVRIPIGFQVPAGQGYRLLAISSPSLIRSTSGSTYPYVSTNNTATITSGFITNSGSATYYYFYDWRVTNGCVSPRTPVVATVIPPSVGGTATADQIICTGTAPADLQLTGQTGNVVKWQQSADFAFTTPVDIAVTATTLTSAQMGALLTTTYYRAVVQSGSCAVAYSNVVTITVSNAPSATISYAGTPYCANAGTATVTLTGSAGGVFSSTAGLVINAATGAIDLGASTPGTYTVSYDIAASGGCSAFSTTTSVTITAIPAATILYAGSPYCSNGGTATVTFSGTTGGSYSAAPAGLSINAATGEVTLGTSTAGTYTVTYTIPAAGGCVTSTATTNITITTAPSATISYAGSPYCSTAGTATVTFTGTTGGTYSASPAGLTINATTGEVNTATSTAGTYTVTYTVAAAGGCAVYTTTASITITAAPAATISYAASPYCSNGGTATVTFTGTAGGTYTASPAGLSINAATGAVTLGTSTPGTYTVTYTVTAAGGCALFSTTAPITVTAAPAATISYAGSPYCISAGTATVTQTGTGGGTYSAPAGLSINATTGAITLGTSTAGTYTVTYTVAAAGGCAVFTTTTSVTISPAGTWLGVTSTDWNTASNWCGGIPTSTTDVVIPSTAPNMPNLSAGTGAVRNLSISNGGTVTVGNGGTLDLYGNISGAGTFTATNGSLAFRGTTSQATPGISATNITMNGTGGWVPGGNSTVTGALTLTNGHITLGANNLALASSSTGTVGSHIITNGTGRVVVTNLAAGNSRIVPVGSDAASYNPVTLFANAGHTTDNFTVGVQNGVFVNGVSGTSFNTHVVDRMWSINEANAGGSNVNVTLQWTAGQELTNFARAKSYIMQHNGTSWIPGTETAAAGTDPYTQSKQAVTSFGAFAVQTQPIPRPLTGIYPNPTNSQLNVVIDLPGTQKVTLTVFDAIGRQVKQTALTLNNGLNQYTMNVYDLSAGVYFIKVSISSNPEFMLTRFVKE